MDFSTEAVNQRSKARAGKLLTDRGTIETPVFMPVGTAGSVKGVHQRELDLDIKAQIILGNTYHLYLRPGMDVISKAGGLHKLINWNKPILTDSGGYQVFSLAATRKLTQEGAIFRSHIDGSKHVFSPERVVDIQRNIGADIIMAFDECTPFPCEQKYAEKSMLLTHRWLERCVHQFRNTDPLYGFGQSLFPIVQGSTFEYLRKESAAYVASFEMDGNAIGGLSVGEPAEDMYAMIEVVNNILPENKPRYLMGVGTPVNILEGIDRGVDMFDCVMPTRNGRNGMLFTENGIINIKNEKWRIDFSPIDPSGTTFVDLQFSKAYLRHLIISKELLGAQIASIHNLGFYCKLVNDARNQILKNTFHEWKKMMVEKLNERL